MRETQNKTVRNYSIDLLKITAMLMVVILHITSHGIHNATITMFSFPYWIVVIMNSFSLVAVNCFVLISGYFLSERNTSIGRIVPLWIQVFTYSVGVYVLLCVIPDTNVQFSFRSLIEHSLPLMSNQYWFFKYYVLLLIFSPFLNLTIKSLEKKQYTHMLGVCIVLFSIVPSVNVFGDTFGAASGYSLVWFVFLYFLAGYLRKYPPQKRSWFRLYVCSSMAILMMRICGSAAGGVFQIIANLQQSYNSPLVTAGAVFLFLAATNGPASYGIKSDMMIRKVSGLSFAVYLLHDHGAVSSLLWNNWICLEKYTHSGGTFIVRAICAWVLIFICGILTELVRDTCNRTILKLFRCKKQNAESSAI